MKPSIKKENVVPLLETKFINVYDLQYEEGKHYFDASRRKKDHLAAVKSDAEIRQMTPDAVTCVVILEVADHSQTEPLLLLSMEYRYPTGQYLLSPPAGLLDEADIVKAQSLYQTDAEASQPSCGVIEGALLSAARREIYEETGIQLKDSDRLEVISPLLFSSPGMTDESNGLVLAVAHLDSLDTLSQEGAVGSECFDGFCLLNKAQALDVLKTGRDKEGNFYSVYTFAALMYFVTDMWRN